MWHYSIEYRWSPVQQQHCSHTADFTSFKRRSKYITIDMITIKYILILIQKMFHFIKKSRVQLKPLSI